MIRFLPGLAGALAGFITLKVFAALGVDAIAGQLALFLLGYAIVAVAADRALIEYGKRR